MVGPRDYADTPEPAQQAQDYEEHERSRDAGDRRFWRVLWIVFAIGIAMLVYAASADAHQAPTGWRYPLECCSNRDCAEIPASAVREGPDGYEIRLFPGQHPMVKDVSFFAVVPYQSARPAPDGAYHVCISPALTMLCFFAGARGF